MTAANNKSSDWERFGELDPYWAVLTDEKFRAAKLSMDSRQEFFQSGETHLACVKETIRTAVDPGFSPLRVLDVGCGVGRVLLPMARQFPEAVGLDVASSMLREAQKNLGEAGLIAELVLADDELSGLAGTFDFIHSYIVFQHIPPRHGEKLCAALLKRLRPGGVAAMHFSYRAPLSRRQQLMRWGRLHAPFLGAVANVAKGRSPSSPYMELYEYELDSVFEIFRATGSRDIHLQFSDHGGLLGVFVLARKERQAD